MADIISEPLVRRPHTVLRENSADSKSMSSYPNAWASLEKQTFRANGKLRDRTRHFGQEDTQVMMLNRFPALGVPRTRLVVILEKHHWQPIVHATENVLRIAILPGIKLVEKKISLGDTVVSVGE